MIRMLENWDKSLISATWSHSQQLTRRENQAPYPAHRELIAAALKSQANSSKSFQSFFIETMELILRHAGRLNFTQMTRCGRSCVSRFRQNFKKSFDRSFLESARGHRIVIAIEPCHIFKSGKKAPGIDWFWYCCAAAMKKVLEMPSRSLASHTVRQETRRRCRLPSTLRPHPSTLPGPSPVSKGWVSQSDQPKPCGITLQWWIDLLQCQETPNMRLYNTDFKELYSMAFEPCNKGR